MFNNLEEFIKGWKSIDEYFNMLALMASLSKLFSDSRTPYLDYRLAENLFCKYYSAINDARSCTAYDARLSHLGIGIKTFILKNNRSKEKIAEFNKLSKVLEGLSRKDLAIKIAQFRNDRMIQSNNVFGVNETQYHIIGRDTGCLKIFNSPYTTIDIDHIHVIKDDDKSIAFEDSNYEYTFNKSKNVLLKNFELSEDNRTIEVEILDDPLRLLSELIKDQVFVNKDKVLMKGFDKFHGLVKGVDYVILPLYSTSKGGVPERSGLNQWNAKGRKRDYDEVYIPIPAFIHKHYPDFFPGRDTQFELQLPDGKILNAKVCQENGKALMSNPNADLGKWLLRTVLRKKPGELVTKFDLDLYGIDSVRIEKMHKTNENSEQIYSISFVNDEYESYDSFSS